jgi:hypothetical protein
MSLHRAVSVENKRPLILSLIAMAVLSLLPISAHATVFWDDEMESGNSGYGIVAGAMSYDTSIKFSGAGSTRLDYSSVCYPDASAQANCGGFMDRTYTPTNGLYRRFYFRMSSGFQVSDVFTKMMRSDTNGPNSSNWWVIGCCGGKLFIDAAQSPSLPGSAQNFYSTFTFRDAQWYCVETYEQLNTPGVSNGISRAWVDGALVMDVTNIPYKPSGDNSLFYNNRLYRQTGLGSIWYDRLAVGDTRIGCLGSVQTTDTTPPAVPLGLFVR